MFLNFEAQRRNYKQFSVLYMKNQKELIYIFKRPSYICVAVSVFRKLIYFLNPQLKT